MRTPPPGAASTDVWRAFNVWADAKLVPAEQEDWEYLWDCFLAGAASAVRSKEDGAVLSLRFSADVGAG